METKSAFMRTIKFKIYGSFGQCAEGAAVRPRQPDVGTTMEEVKNVVPPGMSRCGRRLC